MSCPIGLKCCDALAWKSGQSSKGAKVEKCRAGEVRNHYHHYNSHFKDKSYDPSRHLQESPDPPGLKSQKSLKKGLFGGAQKSPKKYPKKSKNTDFRAFLGIF